MNVGSEEHKQLFCQSFISSRGEYEPEQLPPPDLNGADIERLRSIAFWQEALSTQGEAGVMVSAATTVSAPTIRSAIALHDECFRSSVASAKTAT